MRIRSIELEGMRSCVKTGQSLNASESLKLFRHIDAIHERVERLEIAEAGYQKTILELAQLLEDSRNKCAALEASNER